MNGRAAVGTAFGKVILFGEHAVVWGTDALAAALPEGMVATAADGDGPLAVEVPAWGFRIAVSDGTPHGEALSALLGSLSLRNTDVSVTIQTALVPRAGLGASAALAASTARALCAYNRVSSDAASLFDAVQASEKVFHGNPSGLDAAVALFGGTILFSKAERERPVATDPLPLLIVHSGAPGDTRLTVDRFASAMAADPKQGEVALRRISDIVAQGTQALLGRDLRTVGALMTQNHRILSDFGVSTTALDAIVDISLASGALGAKLTGGGGGGCAIVLPNDNGDAIEQKLHAAGFRVLRG